MIKIYMAKSDSITIIDDKNIRGVVASAKYMPKELLEDIIDLIELSSKGVMRETVKRIRKADKENSWIPLSKIRK